MPKKNSKKASKKATKAPVAVANPDAPKIVAAKGGFAAGQLLAETLNFMEEENFISKKAARDFVESLQAAVHAAIADGKPVNLFGIVKLTPRLHTAGKREVFKEFGNPESGKMTKKYPAKVSLKATVLKPVKDKLPNAAKMGKAVGR